MNLLYYFLLGSEVVAQEGEYTPLSQGLPDELIGSANDAEAFLTQAFIFIISIVTLLAVIWIVFGGIQYMTTDAYSGKSAGKEKIKNALLGLLLAGASWIILYTINPNLVNINLDFNTSETEESMSTEEERQESWSERALQYVVDTRRETGIGVGDSSWLVRVNVSDGSRSQSIISKTGNRDDCRELLRQLQRDSRNDGSDLIITENTVSGFCQNENLLQGTLPTYNGTPARKDKYTAIEEADNEGGSVIIGTIDIKGTSNIGLSVESDLATIEIYGKDRADCQAQLEGVLDFYETWATNQNLGSIGSLDVSIASTC